MISSNKVAIKIFLFLKKLLGKKNPFLRWISVGPGKSNLFAILTYLDLGTSVSPYLLTDFFVQGLNLKFLTCVGLFHKN